MINKFISKVDTDYSYTFAKSMEQFKTNEKLGYRTAGSEAEAKTGEMIYNEMNKLGLDNVTKDYFTVDAWEFKKAELSFKDEDGEKYTFTLGAYQTEFNTHGKKKFQLVYVGKGKNKDYNGIDVKGKLVLADINQREEWWINYPVYQAYLKGAAAFIAIQENGYGEASRSTLNAQDIAGPKEAAAFSMSRADADILKEELRTHKHTENGDEIEVTFNACSSVRENVPAFNVTGQITGRTSDIIMLSAHYDSYFSGFQDDNMAIGMLLSMARTFKKIKYKPEKTILFVAMAAEEWGAVNTKYDWSIGCYNEVHNVHPEWAGHVFAAFNFELPAIASDKKDLVRCTYEYVHFMNDILRDIEVPEEAFPEGIKVRAPIQTWSDDFSLAIAGIPSLVNEFASGKFMKTHYHTQFDNDDMYEQPVYRFHHELYGRLVMEFDKLLIPPFDFRKIFAAMASSLEDSEECEFSDEATDKMFKLKTMGGMIYECIENINENYAECIENNDKKGAEKLRLKYAGISELLFKTFKLCQDKFCRLDWYDEVIFPEESAGENIVQLQEAKQALLDGDARAALSAIYEIDNNRYAFLFEHEVYQYFTDYVLNAEPERLFWGRGRIWHHVDLYDFVMKLRERVQNDEDEEENDYKDEIAELERIEAAQRICYSEDIKYMLEKLYEVESRFEKCIKLL